MTVRIAHVIATFYNHVAYTRMLFFAQEQKRRGRQVEFIVGRNASPELMRETARQGFPVTQIRSLRKYVHPFEDGQALLDLTRLFRQRRFDVVHTHVAKAGILGRVAARVAGVKRIIHTVYGATFAPTQSFGTRFLYKNLEKLAGLGTDLFIFVGQELRHYYIQSGICPAEKSVVIYGGRNLPHFLQAAALSEQEREARRRALGCHSRTIILGNVSRLVPWKGHDYALQVLHRLQVQNSRIKLVIVGDTKTPSEKVFKQKLLDKVKSLHLEDNVLFTGWQQNPAPYYALFDIYLLTSLPFEGVPGAVIESACLGLPIVGFFCFGMGEIPGVVARLVPTRDVEGLTAAVQEEIAHLPEMSQTRRQRPAELDQLLSRFSMTRMVAEMNAQYEKLFQD